MVGIFVDQHMRQQPGTGTPTLDRPRRQRCLREAIAAGTGHPGPHDAVHNKPAGHIFQFLGHILTQAAPLPVKEIAQNLQRAPCSIYREITRNSHRDEEDAPADKPKRKPIPDHIPRMVVELTRATRPAPSAVARRTGWTRM